MEWFLRNMSPSDLMSSNAMSSAHEGIERCPFLRNINEPTSFSFNSLSRFPAPTVQGAKGPIFEDGPDFDMAFRLFHGQDGVVPLSGRPRPFPAAQPTVQEEQEDDDAAKKVQFNPLAARAATISLSSFGFGPFGFDSFSDKWNKQQKKRNKNSGEGNSSKNPHESKSNEWLDTGLCPIAKSYRAVNNVLPLLAKAFQPPPGVILRCPPAIVAARAALARTSLVKNLRPQPLPAKMLAIALMGMAANIPLGMWREHTKKFSPQWFVAVHAAVPFIAMLRKSVVMPKTAMAVTIAASILGQTIGARAERLRLKAATGVVASGANIPVKGTATATGTASCGLEQGGGAHNDSDEVVDAVGEQLAILNLKVAAMAAAATPGRIVPSSPKAQACY